MSDGDDADASDGGDVIEAFERRLEEAAETLEAADTEADLDEVAATLDEIEADLEDADIPVPEPEDDEEDPEDPTEDLEDELSDLRDGIEEKRGPYDTDVIDAIDDVRSTITGTRWAEEGENELVPGVQEFLDTAAEIIDAEFGEAVADTEELSVILESVTEAVEDADLDADEDAETIADLLSATDTLSDAVDAATAWTDLEIRERLHREGFYEPIEGKKHKDFPPEWSALKAWEKRGNVEMVVLLLDLMGDTEFMARHCIEALEYMGDEAGLDPLMDLANRRNLNAIDAIGKIGAEEGTRIRLAHGGTNTRLTAERSSATLTSTEDLAVGLQAAPDAFALKKTSPNPVSERATVAYALPEPTDVTIAVYDMLGRRVVTLTDGAQPAGQHRATLDAGQMPSGTYFVRMRAEGFQETRQLTVVQ